MQHELPILINITVALLAAFVGGFLARRLKLPSMVGVYSRPRMPPARFMGPVCTPLIPISLKRLQSSGSPRLRSTDSPGRVMWEGG